MCRHNFVRNHARILSYSNELVHVNCFTHFNAAEHPGSGGIFCHRIALQSLTSLGIAILPSDSERNLKKGTNYLIVMNRGEVHVEVLFE